MKKITKIISSIIINLVIVFLLVYLIITSFFPNKAIDILGFRTYVVLTTSMEPKIKTSDMIILTKADRDNIKIGSIITFNAHGVNRGEFLPVVVTHYVGDIKVDENGEVYYLTQGYEKFNQIGDEKEFDVWYSKDGERLVGIKEKDIIGKFSFKILLIGSLTKVFQEIVKYPILIILVSVNIFIVWFLIYYIKSTKNEQSNKIKVVKDKKISNKKVKTIRKKTKKCNVKINF